VIYLELCLSALYRKRLDRPPLLDDPYISAGLIVGAGGSSVRRLHQPAADDFDNSNRVAQRVPVENRARGRADQQRPAVMDASRAESARRKVTA
jgi:hypothetical protein